MKNQIDISNVKRIHFVGIGGCSMSGIARLYKTLGYSVTGSDMKDSPFIPELLACGIPVTIGHDAKNAEGSDLIVYSAAIKSNNVEREYANAHGIPQIERCDALGILSMKYKNVVGISGCHGKTTITSMLALINEKSKNGASVHVGGYVDFLSGGVCVGDNSTDTFITEACEYVESFMSLNPKTIVMNNIDDDHLDYFKDIDHITGAFFNFAKLLPNDGLLIACIDDERVKQIYDSCTVRKLSYGMSGNANYFPGNVDYDCMGCPSFDLMKNNNGNVSTVGHIKLNVIGDYNMVNAIAAAVCALSLGIEFGDIATALSEFKLARRRFELYGEMKIGAKVYHDYAHHPGEIKAVLAGAKRFPHGKLFVVFQCNSYSRAKTLFTKDVTCFAQADTVLVPDIYPGRETDDGTVHARDMVRAINENAGCEKALYIADFEGIDEYLRENAKKDDLILTLGSGNVFEKTRMFLD